MNKKIAIAMASNVALALLMTTGCRSLTAGRTAFGGEKVDPYKADTKPEVTISTPEETTTPVTQIEVTPVPVVTEPPAVEITETAAENTEKEVAATPTTAETPATSASYDKFLIPTGYENPTEGLTPVKDKKFGATTVKVDEEKLTTSASVENKDGEFFTYTVKSGDCLSVIANSNGVKTKELAELNGLKPDAQVRIGQKLKVPAGRKPFTSSKKVAAPEVNDGSVYVVKSGDCLSVIAKNLGVKTAELMAANNLKDANNIWVGQKLKIPANAKTPAATPTVTQPSTSDLKMTTPTVTTTAKPTTTTTTQPKPVKEADPFDLDQKGKSDPFAPISEATKETVKKVEEKVNEVKDAIVIPPAPIEAEETTEGSKTTDGFDFNIDDVINNFNESASNVSNAVIEKIDTVKIQKGDTLDFVAANYNTTVEVLCKLNGFDKTKELKDGEVIKIPSQSIK